MTEIKVLIPVDLTDERTAPLRMAGLLAKKAPVRALLLHLFQPPAFPSPMAGAAYYGQFYEEQRKAFADRLAEVAKSEHLDGCQAVYERLEESMAATGVAIGQYAKEHGYDLILTSVKNRTQFETFVEGSELTRLVRNAETPVLCLSEGQPLPEFRLALCTTDLSERSARGLLKVGPLLMGLGARLVAVHITTPSDFITSRTFQELRGAFLDLIARENAALFAALNGVEAYHESDLTTGVLHAASDHGADVVALGTHGRTGISLLVEGSVTQHVLESSHLPLLTYRLPSA